MPQALPQQMPHFEGQGKPQGLGTPYSLLPLPLPTPVPYSSPFVVTSPARASASTSAVTAPNEVVSATRRDKATSTIDHLDFTAALPCEHTQHKANHEDEPARYVVEALCPNCGAQMTYLLCASGWRRLMKLERSKCSTCGRTCHASEGLTIVRVIA